MKRYILIERSTGNGDLVMELVEDAEGNLIMYDDYIKEKELEDSKISRDPETTQSTEEKVAFLAKSLSEGDPEYEKALIFRLKVLDILHKNKNQALFTEEKSNE